MKSMWRPSDSSEDRSNLPIEVPALCRSPHPAPAPPTRHSWQSRRHPPRVNSSGSITPDDPVAPTPHHSTPPRQRSWRVPGSLFRYSRSFDSWPTIAWNKVNSTGPVHVLTLRQWETTSCSQMRSTSSPNVSHSGESSLRSRKFEGGVDPEQVPSGARTRFLHHHIPRVGDSFAF